jgi:hypothetical protein
VTDPVSSLAEVVRFVSPLPVTAATKPPTAPQHLPWAEIPIDQLSQEIIHRNGRFQQLLGWMRHSLQANAVLDGSGRVIFINHAAEELWHVRLFDVQGKHLCQIMHLSESETMRDCRERQISMEELRPHVIMEGFNHGSEHVSVLYFPYADDDGDVLMGVFILPLILARDSNDGRRHREGW